MTQSTTTTILNQLLEPVSSSLNEEAARNLIDLQADAKVQNRVKKLAAKCSEGKLSTRERSEYETYVIAGELIAILKAKARMILSRGKNPE